MKHGVIAVLLAGGLLAGCDLLGSEGDPPPALNADEEATAEPQDDALRAARIAREIRAAPDDSEAILEQHGLTIEELEELMYEISADPEASERYEEALSPE